MEEQTLYDEHPAMFRNHPFAFILCIVLVAAFGLGLIILLIWWINTLGTRLTVTNTRIALRKGLLSKYTNEVYHTDIRNIQIDQSFLQRILNVGTIGFSTAGQDGIEITVAGLPRPESIRNIIDTYRRQGK